MLPIKDGKISVEVEYRYVEVWDYDVDEILDFFNEEVLTEETLTEEHVKEFIDAKCMAMPGNWSEVEMVKILEED